jgi:hypothetical protein
MRDSAGNDDRLKRFLTPAEIRELFLEMIVSRQCASGNGELLMNEFADGALGVGDRVGRVPAWFRAQELGLAIGCSPSIITTVFGSPDQPSLVAFNRSAKRQARAEENDRIRAHNAEAKRRGLKSYAKPIDEAQGCSGCVACVPDARLRPRRVLDGRRLGTWVPKNPNGLGRHASATVERQLRRERDKDWNANVRRLTGGARDLRRIDRENAKAAALELRKQRAESGRAQMQKRRAEQKAMRAVARRAGVSVQAGELTIDKPSGQP